MNVSTSVRDRPRRTASRDAVLRAAVTTLAKRGYAGMTIEAVTEAAGAGRTTIYRFWPSRVDLAVEALLHESRGGLELPDTGSTGTDFRLQILRLAALLRGPRGDPTLARALAD